MTRDQAGRFLPGPDRSRHRLTWADRSNGFREALKWVRRQPPSNQLDAYLWLKRQVGKARRAALAARLADWEEAKRRQRALDAERSPAAACT